MSLMPVNSAVSTQYNHWSPYRRYLIVGLLHFGGSLEVTYPQEQLKFDAVSCPAALGKLCREAPWGLVFRISSMAWRALSRQRAKRSPQKPSRH